MNVYKDPEVRLQYADTGADNDCLVEIVDRAENTTATAEDVPTLAAALDGHVLLDATDGDVELMCHRCPVTCTVKAVGESALTLVHNREECAKNNES